MQSKITRFCVWLQKYILDFLSIWSHMTIYLIPNFHLLFAINMVRINVLFAVSVVRNSHAFYLLSSTSEKWCMFYLLSSLSEKLCFICCQCQKNDVFYLLSTLSEKWWFFFSVNFARIVCFICRLNHQKWFIFKPTTTITAFVWLLVLQGGCSWLRNKGCFVIAINTHCQCTVE